MMRVLFPGRFLFFFYYCNYFFLSMDGCLWGEGGFFEGSGWRNPLKRATAVAERLFKDAELLVLGFEGD